MSSWSKLILNIRLIVPLDGLEGDRGSGVEALSQHSTKQLHENSVNLIIRVMTSEIYDLPGVTPCIAVIRIATWKMDFVESSFYLLCTLYCTSYSVCYVLWTMYFTLYTVCYVLCTVCWTDITYQDSRYSCFVVFLVDLVLPVWWCKLLEVWWM